MSEKLYKFTLSKPEYPALVRRELEGIRATIGDFEVVKVKYHWWMPTDIHIWCKKIKKKDK